MLKNGVENIVINKGSYFTSLISNKYYVIISFLRLRIKPAINVPNYAINI